MMAQIDDYTIQDLARKMAQRIQGAAPGAGAAVHVSCKKLETLVPWNTGGLSEHALNEPVYVPLERSFIRAAALALLAHYAIHDLQLTE